jgi:hypothetical protein
MSEILVPESDLERLLEIETLWNTASRQPTTCDENTQFTDTSYFGYPEVDLSTDSIVHRPVWISFVQTLGLMLPVEDFDLRPLTQIGIKDPKRVRLSQEEISFVNVHIARFFGNKGVIILVSGQPGSGNHDYDGAVDYWTEDEYSPIKGLLVAVRVQVPRMYSPDQVPRLMVEYQWSTLPSNICLTSAIDLALFGEDVEREVFHDLNSRPSRSPRGSQTGSYTAGSEDEIIDPLFAPPRPPESQILRFLAGRPIRSFTR